MNYFALWGNPGITSEAGGRSCFTLYLLLGIIAAATVAALFFAILRPYFRNKKKAEGLKLLEKQLKQGEITEAEYRAKKTELMK